MRYILKVELIELDDGLIAGSEGRKETKDRSLLGLRRGSGLERGAPFHSCAQAGSHPRKGTRGQGQRRRAGEAALCPPDPCVLWDTGGLRDSSAASEH